MNMNLPNKLTIIRVIMIPIFLAVLSAEFLDGNSARIISAAIFVLASLTDALDGYIARSRNLITTFGKFADPLADKLLVCAALIALVELGDLPSWVVILIVSREFIVTGFRVIAAEKGIVIAAGTMGKFKTVFQMLMTIFLILPLKGGVYDYIGWALIIIASVLTVWSLIEYLYKNVGVLKDGK